MINQNIEENLFSMLDEETDSEYVFFFCIFDLYCTRQNILFP
jgi:hypothetical protein